MQAQNFMRVEEVARVIAELAGMGVQVGVVMGGGNIWRGRFSEEMNAVNADQMGMLATLQNCLYMRDTLEHLGARAVVMSGVDIPRFAESYNTVAAIEHLRAGRILFLACGLGNPCFSTDSAVVLRAIELECDAILMAKNIDGVYSADPKKDPTAVKYDTITYDDVLAQHLAVMDSTATSLSMDNHIPVLLFALKDPENILRAIMGEKIGTIVQG